MVVFNHWCRRGSGRRRQAAQILERPEKEAASGGLWPVVRKNRTTETTVCRWEILCDRLRQHRDLVPYHPVYPLAQGGAAQTLAGTVGKERIDEIENPELAMARMQELYEKKGYPKEWIDKCLRGIAVRQDLTDEWKNRGSSTSLEYAILTNEIMHGAFDLKVEEYKQVKGLERENLRDHMTDIELILTMLGEATTTKLHWDRDSQGFEPLKKDAKDGGVVAGRTRKDIEVQAGKPVVTGENFKQLAGKGQKKLNGNTQ